MTALPPIHEPPHNLDAEQALLGALMANNQAVDALPAGFTADHFYHAAHRTIFTAIVTLVGRGDQASPVSLKPYLQNDGVLEQAGGVAYLARCVSNACIGVHSFAKGIMALAVKRQALSWIDELSRTLLSPDPAEDLAALLGTMESGLQQIADGATDKRNDGMPLHEAMRQGIDQADRATRGDHTGIPTGIKRLDAIYGGMNPGDLIILAGRPSMGKSLVAQVIAFNEAIRDGEEGAAAPSEGRPAGVAFFQLEMSTAQMGMRGLAWASGIPYEDMRRGDVKMHDFSKLRDAEKRAERLHFQIFDIVDATVPMMRAALRRWRRKHPLTLVVIDYLQLIKAEGTYRGNRVAEVSEISGSLKRLAREFGVPVVVLSQLSRDVEKREDKRPQLSDLRESGAIEQDADTVMFVYRPEYYLQRAEPEKTSDKWIAWDAQMQASAGVMEIIIAKQRMGPISTARVGFDGARNRINTLDETDDGQGSMLR